MRNLILSGNLHPFSVFLNFKRNGRTSVRLSLFQNRLRVQRAARQGTSNLENCELPMSIKFSAIAVAAVLALSMLGQTAFADPTGLAGGETESQRQGAATLVSNDTADAWRMRRYCRHDPGRCDRHGAYANQSNHLVWGRCYIKCIMSGHPDDYCQSYNWHFCY